MAVAYRPSHADATYDMKYGVRSVQVLSFFSVMSLTFLFIVICICIMLIHLIFLMFKGGGRSSARETIGRVASGAVAKKILKEFSGTEVGYLSHEFRLLFFFVVVSLCFFVVVITGQE